MIKRFYVLCALVAFLFCSVSKAMVYDNRYFPLYLKPFIRTACQYGHFQVQPFFMVADKAQGNNEPTSISDLNGVYDLAQISNSLEFSGTVKESLLRSDLQAVSSIPFTRTGYIDGQGMAFFGEIPLCSNLVINNMSIGGLAIGSSILFMHVNSRDEFCLDAPSLTGLGNKEYLFRLKENLNKKLKVRPALYSRTVFGDTDIYLRWDRFWKYPFKFRSLDAGLKLGMIVPSSPATPLNNPAAIPVGGEKHWGIYVNLENQFEIKEDQFAMIMFRAIKRFPKTYETRIPAALEPLKYGAFTGHLEVNPGWTFVFNPSVILEGIRDGLGCCVFYNLVAHLEDSITDRRENRELPVNIVPLEQRSSWGMEHVTIGAFYDFAKCSKTCRFLPRVSLYWDIPVTWLVSKRSALTNGISLTIDMNF